MGRSFIGETVRFIGRYCGKTEIGCHRSGFHISIVPPEAMTGLAP